MNYYKLVDLKNKTIYDLGKASSAKTCLPFFANLYQGQDILIFGDESHSRLDDMYELIEYGGEYKEGDFENLKIDWSELNEIDMCYREFYNLFEEIGGKIISNLNDFIRFKYNENN